MGFAKLNPSYQQVLATAGSLTFYKTVSNFPNENSEYMLKARSVDGRHIPNVTAALSWLRRLRQRASAQSGKNFG